MPSTWHCAEYLVRLNKHLLNGHYLLEQSYKNEEQIQKAWTPTHLTLPLSIHSRSSKNVLFNVVLFKTMRKITDSQQGSLSVWSLHLLLLSIWVFLRDSSFLPHPKDVYMTGTHVSTLSQYEWVWVRPVKEACPCLVLWVAGIGSGHLEMEEAG